MFLDNLEVEGLHTLSRIRYNPTYHTLTNSVLSLTNLSNAVHIFTGSTSGQVIKLPDATTLLPAVKYEFYNDSNIPIQIQYNNGTNYFILGQTSYAVLMLTSNSTTAGTWFSNQVFNNTATGIVNYNITASSLFQVSSISYTQIPDLSVTPTAGRYATWFSTDCEHTTNNNSIYCSIFKGGVQVLDSERRAQSVSSNFKFNLSTLTSIYVNGSESVDVRVYRNTNGVTSFTGRSLLMVRLGNE